MPAESTRNRTRITNGQGKYIDNERRMCFYSSAVVLPLHNRPRRINNDFDLFLFFGQLFAVKICVLVSVFDAALL